MQTDFSATERPREIRWDVFISHASEDKSGFVKPLADALTTLGANVWYDAFVLRPGDSLSRSIDKGLAKSNFGIVVISPDFIAKQWTEYELRGLNAKELAGGKVILPIWHNIDREQVLQFSPTLADKFAFQTRNMEIQEIAVKIIEQVRPELFQHFQRKLMIQRMKEQSKPVVIDINKIELGPVRHTSLPAEFAVRVRLLQIILNDYFQSPVEEWLDNFTRDMNPIEELNWWERLTFVFFESSKALNLTSEAKLKEHFRKLFALLNCGVTEEQYDKSIPEEKRWLEAVIPVLHLSQQGFYSAKSS